MVVEAVGIKAMDAKNKALKDHQKKQEIDEWKKDTSGLKAAGLQA